MPTFLNLDTWNRRAHFDLFSAYDSPFFNVCAPVDVTGVRDVAREVGLSFFVACLYLSTRVANEVEPFRYRVRIEDDTARVLVHDRIHAGSTVLLPDDTFTFGYFDYTPDFAAFHEATRAELNRLRHDRTPLNPKTDDDNLIHYSVLPWINFTSFAHARTRDPGDSVPKIVFGQRTDQQDRAMMPVSVEVHHALMDGLHAGRYFERLAAYCADPSAALDL